MNVAAADPEGQAQVAAFLQALQQLGWSEGRNVRIDTRWGENDVERDSRYATELLAFAPDVILASGTLSVAALRRLTHTSPIVFAGVSDPVGAGFVDTLARPGGNVTGFMIFEYRLERKMAGAAERDRTAAYASGFPPRFRQSSRHRSIRRCSGRSAVSRR
jgi:putative ABC transport system substrate-binding protein